MKSIVLSVALGCSNGTCTAPKVATLDRPIRTAIVQPINRLVVQPTIAVATTPRKMVRRVRTNQPVITLVKRLFCR